MTPYRHSIGLRTLWMGETGDVWRAAPATKRRTIFSNAQQRHDKIGRPHGGSEFDDFLEEHATHPLLRYVFHESMSQWFQTDSDSVSPVLFPSDLRNLIQRQNAIGWRNILRGRFSHEWQRLQNDYDMKHHRKTRYKRTGARWQQKFITVI